MINQLVFSKEILERPSNIKYYLDPDFIKLLQTDMCDNETILKIFVLFIDKWYVNFETYNPEWAKEILLLACEIYLHLDYSYTITEETIYTTYTLAYARSLFLIMTKYAEYIHDGIGSTLSYYCDILLAVSEQAFNMVEEYNEENMLVFPSFENYLSCLFTHDEIVSIIQTDVFCNMYDIMREIRGSIYEEMDEQVYNGS